MHDINGKLTRPSETNALDQLYRGLAQTERYQIFKNEVKAKNSTVVLEIIKTRLEWVRDGKPYIVPASDKLFANKNDVRIISNDFPYNFDPSITHLVVWTKVPIESDPESEIGDVTEETRQVIDKYVENTFVKLLGLDPKQVIWFRNFPAIQSVRELSHIHVLIHNMSKEDYQKVIKTPGVTSDLE